MARRADGIVVAAAVILIASFGFAQASAFGVSNDNTLVTCGSTIKLEHQGTRAHLHSHEIMYGSGSGQQSVTGNHAGNEAASYWIVRGTEGSPCRQGQAVKIGQALRLQHATTRRWLHSHHFPSPLTNKQEVSAFGDDGKTDSGDVWILQHGGGKSYPYWQREGLVQFKHEETGTWLASSGSMFGRPIGGQQEVCAKPRADRQTTWRTTEGIYFPLEKA